WLRARQYGALPAELTSIPDHDWAGFARALGAQGFTVREPAELESTFQKALAADATALIDVKADKKCPTPVYDFSAGARLRYYHEYEAPRDRARHDARGAARQRGCGLGEDGAAARGAGRRLRRPVSRAAQPSRARAPHRGTRLLSQVRGRAS